MNTYTDRTENQRADKRTYTTREAFHQEHIIIIDTHTGFETSISKKRFERDFVETK